MSRVSEAQQQRIEDVHQTRERLNADRRELQRSFESMMLERRTLGRDLDNMAEASRTRRRLRD